MADVKVRLTSKDGSYIDIDKKTGLKSVESISQATGDPSSVFYGSVESFGSLETVDLNGHIEDLISEGVINNSNLQIDLIANGEYIQHHISKNSSYTKSSKTFSVELGDRLSVLDRLKYKGYEYKGKPENLATLLFDVLSNLRHSLFSDGKDLTEEEFIAMLSGSYDELGTTLYDFLNSTLIEYPKIEADKTYREVIDSFCFIAQMQMYINHDNNVVFVSAMPNVFNYGDVPIHIPKKNMFSPLDYSVILKNKYNNISVKTTNFYYEKEQTIGDPQNITYNDFSDGKWTSKTDEVPSTYEFKLTNEEWGNGAHRWYGEIKLEFNFDEDYIQNAKIKYTPEVYAYQSTYLELDNSAGIIYLDLPSVSARPDNFRPSSSNKYMPVVYTEYNDSKDKIIIHLCFWVGGAIESASSRYFYLANNRIEVVADKLVNDTTDVVKGDGVSSLEFSNKNLLLQDVELANNIIDSILNNYKQGVPCANVSVSCNDYYDSSGQKVIDWSKGEILRVNQIVYFDGDTYKDSSQRYWKIKGRKFRKTGVPMIDLELQQINTSSEWEAPAPIINISGSGNYRDITIETRDDKFEIYYVLSESKVFYPSVEEPMPNGTYYSTPITVRATETTYYTVQAVTRKDDKESVVVVATFSIDVPDVPTIVANYRTGINVDNTVKDVTITSNADEIYYSVNSSTAGYPSSTTPNTLYTGQFTIQNTSSSQMYYTISAYAVKDGAISQISTINTSIATGTGSSGGSGSSGGGIIGNL